MVTSGAEHEGGYLMRHTVVVLASIFLAVLASGVASAVEPEAARNAVKSCTDKEVRLSSAERRMLELHNRERHSRGKPRLCVHPKLQKAAEAHSRDMIRKDRFWHGNIGRRLKNFGYDRKAYGENISRDRGGPSPQTTFESWMKSSAHRRNILKGNLDEVGVGAATGDVNGSKTTAWTVDLATRR
jgi:uncharacterized protein YkwD